MSRLWVLMAGACLSVVLPGSATHAGQHPWMARLEVSSDSVIVGEPLSFRVTITNRSGTKIVMPAPVDLCTQFCALHLVSSTALPGEECIGGPDCGAASPMPTYLTKKTYEPNQTVVLRDWEHFPRCAGDYLATFSCQVPDSVTQPERNLKTRETEDNSEVWSGRFSSNAIVIRAAAPEGVERKVLGVFGPAVSSDGRRHEELLRSFPTSTYSAYVVRNLFSRGWTDVETGRITRLLSRGFAVETGGLAPCDTQARPTAQPETRLAGRLYVECRDNWLNLVLQNHPNIWFADELRFRMALDRYLLGDKDGCAAGLEDLAKHGKPYVASKAGELLAAMKAKGMLNPQPPAQ